MCCFSTKTEVHGTRIFARLTGPGTQVLVYQMRYAADAPTAMILPLPVALPAREESVTWRSLKEYPSFFESLEAGFPEPESSSFSRSKSAPVAAAAAPIAVHEVGDFVASFVPSLNDFERVDPRFAISKDVWRTIPEYRDYGFAVFQLKELAGTPHPIAFEFRTRMGSKVFFPTVHIHDGSVHAKDDFDHVLYMQDERFDKRVSGYQGPAHSDSKTGFARSKAKVATFADVTRSVGILDGDLLLHRTPMAGLLPNVDTVVSLDQVASSACGRCSVDVASAGPSLGPSGVALAGLAWIIRRRNLVRG